MKKFLHIKNGRVIDPKNGRDETADLFAKEGKIVASLSKDEIDEAEVIDAKGLVVCPGLVDIHVHLRTPGQTKKETVASGTQAAAAGGVTTVVCMPNTSPALDNVDTLKALKKTIGEEAVVNVYLTGCLTKGRQGKDLAPMAAMKDCGIIGVTDDGDCIQDTEVMRRAAEYSHMLGLPIFDHCQEYTLTKNAVINEGLTSIRLGLKGWPHAAEDIIVARNIIISKYTGAHIHMQHITSGYSVELLRKAKAEGIRVTAEVTPHHLCFTEESLMSLNTNFKMNPPLRTEADRVALVEGLFDGTIDIIATDHAPHTPYEKDVELSQAPFGVIGLQTMLPASLMALYDQKLCDLNSLISYLTHKPAELVNLDKGHLSEGADADITIFDPNAEWVFSEDNNKSLSQNSPWLKTTLRGKVVSTIFAGNKVFSTEIDLTKAHAI